MYVLVIGPNGVHPLTTSKCYLPPQPSCDVNIKVPEELTALHIAAHKGHTLMVERLVGYAADINAADSDGNTPLHLALGCRTMATPSTLSPRILEVELHVHMYVYTCTMYMWNIYMYIPPHPSPQCACLLTLMCSL